MTRLSPFTRWSRRLLGGHIRQVLTGAALVLLLVLWRLWQDSARAATISLALIAVFLIAGLVTILALRLVRQMHALQRATEALVRGDYEKRAQIIGFGEAADLARSFNHALDLVEAEHRSLVNAERRWLLAMEGSGLGVWDWNVKHDKIFYSPQWKAMLGYTANEISDSMREWFDRIHPDDLNPCYAELGRHTQGDAPSFRLEYRMRAKNGSWRWVLGQGMVLERAQDGSPLRIAGTHIDVTERHDMEQALRDSEQHLRRILNSLFSFVAVLTPDGLLTEINEAPLKASGMRREEVIGRHLADTWWATHSPETQARIRDAVKRAALGEFVRHDERIRIGDGQFIDMDFAMSPMRDAEGRVTHLVPSAVDISARKAAERELSRHRDHLEELVAARTAELGTSEARTLAILATLQDAVIQVDDRGRILTVNHAAASIFGYSESELLERNVLDLIPEQYRHAHQQGMAGYRAGQVSGLVGSRVELEGLRRDGASFALELSVSELARESGLTFIGVLRDITERRAIEQGREAALAEARRLAKVKSEFLANMSHEIRTPLNGVLGLAQIGARDSRGRKSQETFERILDSGQHLLAVINDILDFSKIEAGKLKVETMPFELASTVESAVSFIAARAEAKRLPLELDLEPGLPEWVSGDALRLNQILINLLSNAVKFTERGAVRLAVRSARGGMEFEVRDSGIGMTPDQLARIFHAFEQADGSTTRVYGGTGLGLAISQNLAQLMGGKIGVDSAPGSGSAFTLWLPLTAAAAAGGDDHPPLASGASLAGIRILAAEDVEANRLVLEDMLAEEGASVSFAHNGREALDRLEASPDGYDIVLMDIQMPVMDGHEAASHIRARWPELPVIGLTAHAMAEERQRCLAVGMVEHVTKPIDLEKLLAAILRHVKSSPPAADNNNNIQQETPGELTMQQSTLIDWPALMKRYRNRAAFIDTLAASVLASETESPARLRSALAEGDFDSVVKLAHNMKSVSGNFEAWPLNQQAVSAEKAAREHAADAAAEAARLAALIDDFIAELNDRESHLGPIAKAS